MALKLCLVLGTCGEIEAPPTISTLAAVRCHQCTSGSSPSIVAGCLADSWTVVDILRCQRGYRHQQREHSAILSCIHQMGWYAKYVKYPMTAAEAAALSIDHNTAGFHGCVVSTGATHILCELIPVAVSNLHCAYKLLGPARMYNLTCDHRRRILYSTNGHPA
jgi:hypothetical protein